jgi:RNA polymerase sigma factor (sigma-70 family)
MSDPADTYNDLWRRAISGDEDAYTCLLLKCMPIIMSVIRPIDIENDVLRPLDREDLIAVAHTGIIKAVNRFDPNVGSGKFAAYARSCIRSAVIDLVRKWGRRNGLVSTLAKPFHGQRKGVKQWKRRTKIRNVTCAAGQTVSDVLTRFCGAEDGGLDAKETVEHIHTVLTDEEKDLVRMYYEDGMTFEQIGNKYGVNKSSIWSRHAQILRKARHCMEDMWR